MTASASLRPGDGAVLELALTSGGPFTRLLGAVGLTGPSVRAVLRGGLVLAALTWLPLVVAALAQGVAFGFPHGLLWDVGVHVRLLLALPLLLLAERAVERRLGRAVRYLSRAGIVEPGNERAVAAAIAGAHRMRDTVWVEAALAVAVMVGSAAEIAWGVVEGDWMLAGERRSVAGLWYALVSIALYRFLLLRWLWRLLIWVTLLVRLARAPLRLHPAHPDRMGGLSVVVDAHQSFGWVVLALSATLAGYLTSIVWHAEVSPLIYQRQVVLFVLLAPLLFLLPPIVFFPSLERLRRRTLEEYGAAGADFGRRFREQWLRPGSAPMPLDAADTSTHTDMGTSFERAVEIRRIPIRASDYAVLLG